MQAWKTHKVWNNNNDYKFDRIGQRLVDQVKMVSEKGPISDLEKLEMYGQTRFEEYAP